MSIVVVGLSHKAAPVELLEQLSISDDSLPKALHQLGGYDHVVEGAILSTCNRTEIYASVTKFHGGAQDLRNFLSEFCHVAPEAITDHLYTYHDDAAVSHLFRVASGTDSLIVGESEILGQVRRAYQAACDEGNARRVLGHAFRHALRVGKRARSETAIGRNPVSVSSAAVELARRAFAERSLAGRMVVIVGAGKMGRLAAQALAQAGCRNVAVVNRSDERGEKLARDFGATAHPFDSLNDLLTKADIVICSTTAAQTVIQPEMVRDATAARSGRPLSIVDIAVPRDVDPRVGDIAGVVLNDIDDLKSVVDRNLGSRVGEISKVESLIASELQQFSDWLRSTQVAPTVAALVDQADAIRRAELARSTSKLKELSPEAAAELDHLTRRLVAKLLHGPISRTKELSASKQGHVYLSLLRELFELDDELEP